MVTVLLPTNTADYFGFRCEIRNLDNSIGIANMTLWNTEGTASKQLFHAFNKSSSFSPVNTIIDKLMKFFSYQNHSGKKWMSAVTPQPT